MNLFARIFIGFWLSSTAIIGSWILAAQYFELAPEAFELPQQPPPQRGPGRPGAAPEEADAGKAPRYIFRIYYGLQNVSAQDLPEWIARQERRTNTEILLIDPTGKEIFGRKLVPGTDRLLKKLSGFRRRGSVRSGNSVLFGQEFHRPEYGNLYLVIASHPPASPLVGLLLENLWLRLLLAVLISGAISYAVSYYLTRSLKRLQTASRALAEGKLDTRITVPERGGDEVAELARDFNSMATQLQERIQAQKRLLSDVSHELRSPLARLRVSLALLEKDPADISEQLARIERETERLDELIGQLLAVPDQPVTMEDSLDLVGLLQQVCADAGFESAQADKQVLLETALAEQLIRSHGDLLKKALENVIRNAIDHTPAGTQVKVCLSADSQEILITVEDAGVGIPNADLERVFEPFYRVDEARQRETGGYGLGLSISQRAIARHGGSIQAENLHPGLRVSIRLPRES